MGHLRGLGNVTFQGGMQDVERGEGEDHWHLSHLGSPTWCLVYLEALPWRI